MQNNQSTWLQRLFKLEADELSRCLLSFAIFFSLLCAYYILRPIRDSMAITGGIDKLHWLFIATFLGILIIVPVYGWACTHFRRHWLVTGVYASVVTVLLVLWYSFKLMPDDPWLARFFYVWISIFNLLMVSLFWSLMVDVFSREQAQRLFGFIAAGGSLGALCGPLVSALLVKRVGYVNLMLISSFWFGIVILLILFLLKHVQMGNEKADVLQPLGGHAFSGFSLVFKSPYLLGYSLFIFLLSAVSTFLYFQQAELVRDALPDANSRTQLFAWIDLAVNTLSVFSQIILTGNIVKRFGVTIVLALVPLIIMCGFISFIYYPQLTIVVAILIIRRVGAYAFIRPCREILFTTLSREMKYKAKNFIDTVIYRGGDALSSWFYSACVGFGLSLSGTAVVGAGIAFLCSFTGYKLGRTHDLKKQSE